MFSFFALQCGVQDAHTHTYAVAKWRTAPDPPTPRLSPHLTLLQFPPRAKTNHCSQPVSQLASRSAGRMPRPSLFYYFESSFPAVAAPAVSETQDVPRTRSSFYGSTSTAGPLLRAATRCGSRAAAHSLRLCGFARPRLALVTPGDVGTTQADAARICTSDCCAAAPAATAWHACCHAPLRNLCLPSEMHWRTLTCTYTYALYLIYAPIHDRMDQRGPV
jgi:hypothetical protein